MEPHAEQSLSANPEAASPSEDPAWLQPKVHRRLLAYVTSLVGNRHDAEDVMQRASVIMWRQHANFQPGTDFFAWASTIAFYEAKNFLRVSARAKVVFDDALLTQLADERRADLGRVEGRMEALEECIKKLDDSARKLLYAVYGDDGSIVRLAEVLGKAPKTLYNRLSLIRQVLVECIERRGPEGGAT